MGKKLTLFGAGTTLWLAFSYQWFLGDFLFITLGLGRAHQKIEEFPYNCRRLRSPLLEGCEHMVLDSEGRRLYATCSTLKTHIGWSPGGDKYNSSARELKDHVSVLNIDEPGPDGFYGLHTLDITGDYESSIGGKDIDLHGFDIEFLPDSRLRFWMINHRPAIDESGNFLDATKSGANSTIEVFEHTPGSYDLEFVKTLVGNAIFTPNSVAITGNGSIFFTNDHNTKTGRFRILEHIFGGGSVGFCALDGKCHIAATNEFKFANGIASSKQFVYVAHSASGIITPHVIQPDNKLPISLKPIKINMPVDNLSADSNGDMFVAAFPDVLALMKAMEDPYNTNVPSSIFRIRSKIADGGTLNYEVTKVLEDIEGRVLPGATVAVHDAKTDSFWLGGVMSPFIAVCEGRH